MIIPLRFRYNQLKQQPVEQPWLSTGKIVSKHGKGGGTADDC